MRVVTKYIFEVTFTSPHDAGMAVSVLRSAAQDWAKCSNESEPLLDIADQLERQSDV